MPIPVPANLQARVQPMTAGADQCPRDIVAQTPVTSGLTPSIAVELDALIATVDRETRRLAFGISTKLAAITRRSACGAS
ncbi:hypothetical protein [Xanthobacter tagetidis]|jgi:hypothetical protein|uniref:Uncharacterized protein n=1 Tax=Xanthobacter tagetidis TaxID=60216 RepID=A0A3L7AJZ1_9HYPH|nr:hypothetical protein [Xanthobacter tagetidis]MBB6309189.1 hypothetical protein [Xanthobacter tagetidis]RLP80334.1 hypothetical protein D9R14_04470 [Xanthobacter tagetidis]